VSIGERVRPANDADVDAIASLGSAAFVAAFGPANPPGVVEAYAAEAFSPDRISRQLGDPASRWLVVDDGHHLLGMAHLVEGDAPTEVVGDRPVQLSRLYTTPEATSRGIGSELVAASLDLATDAGHDVMWLGVWEHNPRALAFYQRWGFEQVGTVVFRLGDEDQTDVVMARSLG
jgi:diamine N-acetyltransferase